MKVKVNKDACIGCGACAAICDTVFELDDEGLSVAKKEEVKDDEKQAVRDAADSCPTGAIEVEE
ncbi:MAG: ferredoxin [Mycoplasmatota bacterium]|nr:ferredoxin [Mycoplasmatota bacterium]